MFLPDCSCCGRCGCQCGVLPHTITAKFSGFTQQTTQAWLNADSVSCFGSLAVASIKAPGGKGNNGPIQTVSIRNAGQCYAERDRVMPVLSATGTGTGAVFDVTVVADAADACGRPQWKVDKIATTGGKDYANGSVVTVSASPGDVMMIPSFGKVTSAAGVPTSVALNPAGRYYRPITADRDVPIVTATIGGGAKLSVSLDQLDGDPPVWKVSGVGVSLAGSGISTDAAVTFTAGDRTTVLTSAAAKAVVDPDGGMVAVTVTEGGQYYRDTKLPPRVAAVTFPFGGGKGGVVKGVVEDDVANPRFGQIVDLTIEAAGSNYLGWTFVDRCQTELNGKSIVLQAQESGPLVTPCITSKFGTGAVLEIVSHTRPRLTGSTVFNGAADLSVILEANDTNPKTWGVTRVLGGEGYLDEAGAAVFISAPAGVFVEQPAIAFISSVNKTVPIVTVTQAGKFYRQAATWDGVAQAIPGVRVSLAGSGYAKLGRSSPTLTGTVGGDTVTLTTSAHVDDLGLDYWRIDKATGKASPVNEGSLVTITGVAGDVLEIPGLVLAHTRQQPTVEALPPGDLDPALEIQEAAFTVTLQKSPPASIAIDQEPFFIYQSAFWYVLAIEIDEPGSGYPQVVRLEFETDDTEVKPAAALAYANDLGEIVSVALETAGEYFKASDEVQEYTIAREGVHYHQDPALPPYSSNPTVSLTQLPPSVGTGAEIAVSVNLDTASANFGKLSGASVTKGGSNYQLRGGPGNCTYSHLCPESGASVRLNIAAANVSAAFVPGAISSDDPLDTQDPTRWRGVLANADPVANCSALTTNALTPALDLQNGQITIAPGGQYPTFTPCCFCPCSAMVDFRHLEPCGLTAIIVEVVYEVFDNDDPGRCDNETVTLTLTGDEGPNMWRAVDTGQYETTVFLNCVANRLTIVGTSVNLTCNSNGYLWDVILDSQAAAGDSEACCPIGKSQTFGDPLGVQITVNVTTVLG